MAKKKNEAYSSKNAMWFTRVIASVWIRGGLGWLLLVIRKSELGNSVVVVDLETYDDEVIKKAEATGKLGLAEIYAKEDGFIFTVESTGAVKASQLVFNAVEVLKQKLDAVWLSEDMVEADDFFGELGAHMRGG
ncbi:DNA-directed RNA polymerases II, IV and V subunit 3 [Ancistrocladus abbreviatus]